MLARTLFYTELYPLFCVNKEEKIMLPLEIPICFYRVAKTPIDMHSLAFCKTVHVLIIANY